MQGAKELVAAATGAEEVGFAVSLGADRPPAFDGHPAHWIGRHRDDVFELTILEPQHAIGRRAPLEQPGVSGSVFFE